MTKPICSYCRSGWHPSTFHPGTCGNCGAPILQAIEFVESSLYFTDGGVAPRSFRDANPSSPYWMDGGVSLRSDEVIYAVWN